MALKNRKIVLIDDDTLHHLSWGYRLGNECFRSFSTIDAFVEYFGQNPPTGEEIIFLDYELRNGAHARENAKRVFALGFKTVFIATSHDPAALEPVAGISGVISKRPPDWLTNIADKDRADRKFTKLSASERRDLANLFAPKEQDRLKHRLREYQEAVFQSKMPEKEIDTWERAIFENVSDEELKQRIADCQFSDARE